MHKKKNPNTVPFTVFNILFRACGDFERGFGYA